MNSTTPHLEPKPSTQPRKVVTGGSLMIMLVAIHFYTFRNMLDVPFCVSYQVVMLHTHHYLQGCKAAKQNAYHHRSAYQTCFE